MKPRQKKAKERTAKFTGEEYQEERNGEWLEGFEVTLRGVAAWSPCSKTNMDGAGGPTYLQLYVVKELLFCSLTGWID